MPISEPSLHNESPGTISGNVFVREKGGRGERQVDGQRDTLKGKQIHTHTHTDANMQTYKIQGETYRETDRLKERFLLKLE